MSILGRTIAPKKPGEGGIPTYATVADMQAAVDASELSDGDVAFVTAESSNYFVDGATVYPLDDALVEVATVGDLPGTASEGDLAIDRSTLTLYRRESGAWALTEQAPFGLSPDQFKSQNLFFAWFARERLLQQSIAGTDDDQNWLSAVDSTFADGTVVRGILDAGVNVDPIIQTVSSQRPSWDLTPVSDAARALKFSGSQALILPYSDNEAGPYKFLWDDSSDYTFVLRASYNADPSTAGEMAWFGNLFGISGGMIALLHQSSNTLGWFVKDASTTEGVSYSWTGFETEKLYTIAVRHNSGGITELFIDGFGTPVATATLTTWNTKDSPYFIRVGARGNTGLGDTPVDGDLVGLAITKSALSKSQLEAWDAKFKSEGG